MDRHQYRLYDSEKKEYREPYRFILELTDGSIMDYDFSTLLNPMIPEQCIGLKDREGTDIYEGDIIEISWGDGTKVECFVFWNPNFCSFDFAHLERFREIQREKPEISNLENALEYSHYSGPKVSEAERYLVIGNIHEEGIKI